MFDGPSRSPQRLSASAIRQAYGAKAKASPDLQTTCGGADSAQNRTESARRLSTYGERRSWRRDRIGILGAFADDEAEGTAHRVDRDLPRRVVVVEDERVNDHHRVWSDDQLGVVTKLHLDQTDRVGDDVVPREHR